MKIAFNIKDNEVTEKKILAFAETRGYESMILDPSRGLISNPLTAKDYLEMKLKEECLTAYANKKASEKYRDEYNNKVVD